MIFTLRSGALCFIQLIGRILVYEHNKLFVPFKFRYASLCLLQFAEKLFFILIADFLFVFQSLILGG